MFIALGIVGTLWIVGYFIAPDPNAPQSHAAPPAIASTATPPQSR
jgi:hypothetical protein